MRIMLTGAQGVGKTTLLDSLKEQKELEGYEFVREVVRDLMAKGFKINENGTDETQLAVMEAHIENLKKDKAIFDRGILDCLVYTRYLYEHGKIKESTLNKVAEATKKYIDAYDVIFYIAPEFDIVPDGVRSTQVEFRDEIVGIFEQTIKDLDINVVILRGGVAARTKSFLDVVKFYRTRPRAAIKDL